MIVPTISNERERESARFDRDFRAVDVRFFGTGKRRQSQSTKPVDLIPLLSRWLFLAMATEHVIVVVIFRYASGYNVAADDDGNARAASYI